MNLNKLFYNVAKKIKKVEFRFDYIEDLGILSMPHKMCNFTINDIVDIQEYINLYVDSEYYNISSEDIERLDVDKVADDMIKNIVECYSEKIYEQISLLEQYMDFVDGYYLTIHYNNSLYDVVGEYMYDDGFISCGSGDFEKLQKVFN